MKSPYEGMTWEQYGSALSNAERKYAIGRNALIFLSVFTFINCLLLIVKADIYFLFSATFPYELLMFSMIFCGKMPYEFYQNGGEEIYSNPWPSSVFYIAIVIALAVVAAFVICWKLSKKKHAAFAVGFSFVILDTLVLLYFALSGGILDYLFDIIFRALIIYEISVGLKAMIDLKKLAENEPVEVPHEDDVEYEPQFEISQNSDNTYSE